MLAEKDDRFRAIKRAAQRQGWTVERTRKLHWRFTPPVSDQSPVVFGGSPSRRGAITLLLARLRQRGFEAPERFGGRGRRKGGAS